MGDIVRYNVTLISSTDSVEWVADIRCYDTMELGTDEVAVIHFFPDGTALPPDKWRGDVVNGVPIVNYHISRFNDVITALRDEPHVSVNTFFWTSGEDSVDGWGVSTGLGKVGGMDPTP